MTHTTCLAATVAIRKWNRWHSGNEYQKTLLHPAVAAALGEGQIMDKPTFGSIDLMHQLVAEHQREPLALELVGLCTDICVVSNALLLKAAMPEVEITVDAACCAGVTPESHRHALETMKMCQIKVVND